MYTEKLLDFIKKCPTAFHAAQELSAMLKNSGAQELYEHQAWDIEEDKKYFVRRNSSSIIAFSVPKRNYNSFMIVSSHSDSPAFKIKPNPEINTASLYTSLNTERYGGMILGSWFDRPLSVAGRVVTQTKNGLCEKLINIDRDLLMIPSVAPHIDSGVNKKEGYDIQTELIPLLGIGDTKNSFMSLVAKEACANQDDILSYDLFLYNRQEGIVWGIDNEFFSSPRIDNLQCAFSSAKAFMESNNSQSVSVMAVFDNEEVGSGTRQGALSTFLLETLKKINEACGKSETDYYRDIASSMALSADNGHAVHPNYSSKHDITNRPVPNGGVLIKQNASQKYTTDALSEAILVKILKKNNIPYCHYVNHSNVAGGSTLGHLSEQQVSLLSADIGAAQLAMHSAYETAGTKDTEHLVNAMKAFYNTTLKKTTEGYDF